MATYNSSDMTSGPVKAIHAGLNVKRSTYLQDETISAVGQINMTRLPGGARVVDLKLMIDGVPGTGLAVKDSQGNVYVTTSTHAASTLINANGYGLGERLTSSAHIYIEQNGLQAAQAGADSANYRLLVSYLAEEEGD